MAKGKPTLYEVIEDYITMKVNYYGKPSIIKKRGRITDWVSDFWEVFGGYITTNTFILKHSTGVSYKSNLNDAWIARVESDKVNNNTDAQYTGGFEFYEFVELNQVNINSFDDFERIIGKFSYESILTDKESEYISKLQDNVNFRPFYVYKNNKLNQFVALDKESMYAVTSKDGMIKIQPNIVNEVFKLDFKYEYLGTKINTFCRVPSYESINEVFTLLLMEGLLEVNVPKVKESEHSKTSDRSDEADKSKQSETAEESKYADESMIAEESLISEESKTSEESEHAKIADGLTEEGFNKVLSGLMSVFSNPDSEQSKTLSMLLNELSEQQRYNRMHTYEYVETSEDNFRTIDIYTETIKDKIKDLLFKYHRVAILGDSGSSKSELANWLAYEITGEYVGGHTIYHTPMRYKRVCVASARTGESFWHENDNYATIGELRLFVEYIEKNNITGPCVFIGNEIQASDFGYLLGSTLFEDFSHPGISQILPDNLYLIFTGCPKRDFGIDNQVFERVKHVNLTYYTDSEECTLDKNKIIANFGFEDVLEKADKINKIEDNINNRQALSVRKMFERMSDSWSGGTLLEDDEYRKELDKESLKLLKQLEEG